MAKSRLENSAGIIASGLLLRMLTLGLSFLSRTFFIRCLGDDCLGLNGLFTTILTMFSLVELGIGQAITFYMYKPIAAQDTRRLAVLVKFYKLCYRIIGIVIAVLGCALIPLLPSIIKLEAEVPYSIPLLYVLYVANTAVTYLFFSYPRTVLTAYQEGAVVNKVDSVFTFVSVTLEILLLVLTRNFIAFLLVRLAVTIAKNLTLGLIAQKKYPYIRQKTDEKISKAEIKEMFKDIYGLFVVRLSAQLIDSTDNLFISAMIGTVLAGYNSNYMMIINAIYGVVSTIIYSCGASLGNLCATESKERAENVFSTMHFVNFWISCFCTTCLFQLMNPFITLVWGAHYTFDLFTVALMCGNFYIVSSMYTVFSYRQSLGLFRECIYYQFAGAIVNIILDFLLIRLMGIAGLFTATVLVNVFIVCFPYSNNLYKVGFQMKSGAFLFKMIGGYVACAAICGINALICSQIPVTIPGFIAQCVLSVLISNGLILLLFHRTPAFRATLGYGKTLLNKILHR